MADDWDHIDGQFKNIRFRTNSEPPWNNYIEDWYSHTSYIVADDENYNSGGDEIHNYDEVPAGSRNRWSFFKYYEDKPELTDCGRMCNYSVAGMNANFRVEVADGPNEQSDLTISHPYPQNEEKKRSFGLSIGAGFGPISAGVSVSAFDVDASDCSVNETHYHYTEWDLDIGYCHGEHCVGALPDDQENAIGVHFDMDANENISTREVEAAVGMEWHIYRLGKRGGERLYTRTDEQDYTIDVDIVEPNYS